MTPMHVSPEIVHSNMPLRSDPVTWLFQAAAHITEIAAFLVFRLIGAAVRRYFAYMGLVLVPIAFACFPRAPRIIGHGAL